MVRYLELDELESEGIRLVHAHWDEIRRGRRYPAKRDVDPAAIKPVLPYVMISEVHRDPLRIRYRLVGTEAAHYAGADFTGKWLDETGWGDDAQAVGKLYAHMLEMGRPIFGVDHFTQLSDGRRMPYEFGMFPLAADGDTVDHCLVVEDYRRLDRHEAHRR